MKLLNLLIATALFASAPAFAKHRHRNNLKKFLHHTTWCFADKDGPRQGGRIQFFGKDLQGRYDVVDAPGNGGIPIGWNTVDELFYKLVMLNFSSGMQPAQQWAIVEIVSDEKMVWTFEGTDGSVSTLNRCSK